MGESTTGAVRRRIRPFNRSVLRRLAGAGCLALMVASVHAQPPKSEEVRVDVGTKDGKHLFVPNTLRFQRGKLYKLVLHNPSPDRHYFSADGLSTRVFSRKTETLDPSGNVIAEVHGSVREMELFPGATVAWYFYPMIKGKDIEITCHKPGHAEAGMVGTVEIYGPPPFQP